MIRQLVPAMVNILKMVTRWCITVVVMWSQTHSHSSDNTTNVTYDNKPMMSAHFTLPLLPLII